MGMTDRQFDAYQKSLLRELKRAEEEIAQKFNTKSIILEEVIKDIEDQLKSP